MKRSKTMKSRDEDGNLVITTMVRSSQTGKATKIVVVDPEVVSPFHKPTFGTRVREAKETLRMLNTDKAKVNFFDEFYGAQMKSESIRTDNLWAGYIEEEQFTLNLEKYVLDLSK
jgi:hypothetical protein